MGRHPPCHRQSGSQDSWQRQKSDDTEVLRHVEFTQNIRENKWFVHNMLHFPNHGSLEISSQMFREMSVSSKFHSLGFSWWTSWPHPLWSVIHDKNCLPGVPGPKSRYPKLKRWRSLKKFLSIHIYSVKLHHLPWFCWNISCDVEATMSTPWLLQFDEICIVHSQK